MQRIITGILLTILFSCAIFAQESLSYPPDIAKIKERGTLIVAMYDKDMPPFFMQDKKTKKLEGIDITLGKNIARKLGVNIKFERKYKTFDQVIEAVAKRKADIAISFLTDNLERAKKVRFTRPYITLNHGIIINRISFHQLKMQTTLVQTLNTPNAKIAVLTESTYVPIANELFPKSKIIPYNSFNDIVIAVENGRATAGLADEITLKKLIFTRPKASIKLQTILIQDLTDPIAIAAPWDSIHLIYWLNNYLNNYKPSIKIDTLIKQYFK